MQYGLGISEREWCDYVMYCPFIKDIYPLIVVRVERDEKEIKELNEGVDKFIKDMFYLLSEVKNGSGVK